MKPINKKMVIISVILLTALIFYNIINENINKASFDYQLTVDTGEIMIILFARTWDAGISFVDTSSGGYQAFSITHGYFYRSRLIGGEY